FASLCHPNLIFFGLGETDYALESIPHAADSSQCPRCNNQLQYSQVTISHMGNWQCIQCGLSRPDLDFEATEIELRGVENIKFKILSRTGEEPIEAKLPGLHNVYNVLAAFAAAKQLDIQTETARIAIASVNAAFGRTETIQLKDKKLTLLLAKNPAGANSNLETLLLHPERIHLSVLLNDRIADGRDVSWIWDVDYEKIFHKIESLHVGGERAYDLALRFMYGGYDPEKITVKDKISDLIDCLLTETPPDSSIFVLPSYTAMLDLRAELVSRGLTHEFWKEGL
ncbi:MAG TPA: MurT ligase domain-containing protein, partial [Acidimicrobiales bacterium]|nr:MurT ligase domain-containing protein [Acidimicrobiales bacterium]